MKTYQVRIVIVMTIFFVIAVSIGVCSKEMALLAIIVQLLCSILMLLARIYDKIESDKDIKPPTHQEANFDNSKTL